MNAARRDYPRLGHIADNNEYGVLSEQSRFALDEIDRLRAENTQLRRLADLNALRRTLTNPTLQRLTRAAKP